MARAAAELQPEDLRQLDSAGLDALGGLQCVLENLGVSSGGLSASEVVERRKVWGENRLPSRQLKGFLVHLWESFEDETLIILIVSAIISVSFGLFLAEEDADLIQGLAILAGRYC